MLEAQRNAADIRRRLFYRHTPRLEPKFVAPVSVPAPEPAPEVDQPLITSLYRDDEIPPTPERKLMVRDILNAVSMYYQIPVLELISERRTAPLPRARQIAMYLAHKYTTKPSTEIGRAIGGRDHSTVLHGVDKVKYLLTAQPEISLHIEVIKSRLGIT